MRLRARQAPAAAGRPAALRGRVVAQAGGSRLQKAAWQAAAAPAQCSAARPPQAAAAVAATLAPRAAPRSRRPLAPRASGTSSYTLPKAERLVIDVPGAQEIILETGEIGRQANGAIVATMGETVLYATACCGSQPQGDGSFIPLSVHYQERFSAAGRTSGSFLKREGRPRDDDVLVARLVDRPIRPMFEKGWCNETQVLEWVLSYDGTHQPEPLAITAAAAALLISDIPLSKAVAGVRVGMLPSGGFVVNPTAAQMAASRLDLVVAGTADAVLMIEGFCEWLTEEQMLEAIATGHAAISSMCRQLTAWAAAVGKLKRTERVLPPAGLAEQLAELAGAEVEEAYRVPATKEERAALLQGVRARAYEALALRPAFAALDDITLTLAWKGLLSATMRRLVLREGRRSDGRGTTDIRPITCRADVLPRTHGSALFTRGETQALCVATLGSDSDAQRVDSIRDAASTASAASSSDEDDGAAAAAGGPARAAAAAAAAALERFYLQYFFPPSSVGECGRVGPAGRRELGHGELAQRALAPAVPPQSAFPYTVRVESTITESNGSSSMASVCGGCLAMLDAGVPLAEPVAGIAMGLVLEPDGSFVVLSDILGSEDSLGDMDFKVAGGSSGISAFQMDIKVEGITLEIMKKALAQAAEGRAHILRQMAACSPAPRRAISRWAPKVALVQVPADKLGLLIGPGGKTIRGIVAASGASDIVTNNNGSVQIMASTEAALSTARELIELQLDQLPVGTILRGRRVDGITLFGVFVELCPGKSGLVHLSELQEGDAPTEVPPEWQVGSPIDVMFIGATPDGKTRLSRKAVLLTDAGKPYAFGPVGGGRRDSSSSGGGGGGSSSGGGGGDGGGGGGGEGEGGRWYGGDEVAAPRTPRAGSPPGGGEGGGRGRYGRGGGGRGGGRGGGGRGGGRGGGGRGAAAAQ